MTLVILSILLKGLTATIGIRAPAGAATITVVVECSRGFEATSTRTSREGEMSFVFADLSSWDECSVLVGAFDKKGSLLKQKSEKFYTGA